MNLQAEHWVDGKGGAKKKFLPVPLWKEELSTDTPPVLGIYAEVPEGPEGGRQDRLSREGTFELGFEGYMRLC